MFVLVSFSTKDDIYAGLYHVVVMDRSSFCLFAFMMDASIKIWHAHFLAASFLLWACGFCALSIAVCYLSGSRAEQIDESASFQVRHDSRLDFNSSFIEPEKKAKIYTYIPKLFRRTIVASSSMHVEDGDQMVSHVCAGRTQLAVQRHLTLLVWSCPCWVQGICSYVRQDWTTRLVSLCCLTIYNVKT
jgi:hypothetical protein